MVRSGRIIVLAIALSVLGGVGPQVASAGGQIRAVLDGRPVTLAEASSLSCHDFDYPVLTCFRTSAELESAAAARVRAGSGSAAPLSAAVTGYVIVYVDGAYGGSARALSQDYAYLGDIGWNDVISSLKSYGATGHFWQNSPSGGFIYYFYPTTQVSYVGDFYNDKFSAVYFG